MSALRLRFPNSLHERARELARREGISVSQLVASALGEKMSALLTEEYLAARARRGKRSRFLAALGQVPAIEPEPKDRLPEEGPNQRLRPARVRPRATARRTARMRSRG